MEFYEVINQRRTVREWKSERIPQEVFERILTAGMQAPTHNHLREWEFIVLREQKEKETALQFVKAWSVTQDENKVVSPLGTCAQRMYAYAIPRQYSMLLNAPCVIIPLFKGRAGLFRTTAVNSLNSFASIWCVIENIFLSATAEGLACSMRIPVGEEGGKVTAVLGVPQGYMMPCYIGIGYPAETIPAFEQVNREVKSTLHFGKW